MSESLSPRPGPPPPGPPLRLRAAEAPRDDVALGIVRLSRLACNVLDVSGGEVVEIKGRRTSLASAAPAPKNVGGSAAARTDPIVRRNAGVGDGDMVEVQKVETMEAEKVTIAPVYDEAPALDMGPGLEGFVAEALAGRPCFAGHALQVPGVFLLGGKLNFLVVETVPLGPVVVGKNTFITIRQETVAAKGPGLDSFWDEVPRASVRASRALAPLFNDPEAGADCEALAAQALFEMGAPRGTFVGDKTRVRFRAEVLERVARQDGRGAARRPA